MIHFNLCNLPTSLYLDALKDFGKCNTISIVPGHWIDPGIELGAPGERDFNLEVSPIISQLGNSFVILLISLECRLRTLQRENYV